MSQLPSHPLAEPGETAWEHFDADKVYLQRACPDCDHGMIWRPARFCGRCGGSGLITRTVPADASGASAAP